MTSDRRIEQAAENMEPISEVAEALVDGAVASVASDTGRTVEEQWERMGDRFAYEGAEMDPDQKQLDDYELRFIPRENVTASTGTSREVTDG